MIRKQFNKNWGLLDKEPHPLAFMMGESSDDIKNVTLPYDCMIHEKRTNDTKNGHHTGFYPGNKYILCKKFEVPHEWENKTVTFEFEGVYMNSTVYINGDLAGEHPYGYSNFYVKADNYLKYGTINEIKVIANTKNEENSRWYSGSGIYRNVKIMVGNLIHIPVDGIKITTPDVDESIATAVIDTIVENSGHKKKTVMIASQIKDYKGNVIASDKIPATIYIGESIKVRQRMAITNPSLWDCENPTLYYCTTQILDGDSIIDEEENHFGIRRLQLDAVYGLRINGKQVKLRGACIHHDNGIIGACTLERAEERRVQKLKDAGFNCIRSSHHPMSKAMLDACDRIGMLVMDEFTDMWTHSKTPNDYSNYFSEWWERDVELMVHKDFNHPCVIMYSTGNEIFESGTSKGGNINRKIATKIKSIDDTRYTTNAINGMMSAASRIGDILSDITGKSMETLLTGDNSSQGGSDKLNTFLSLINGPLGDSIITHPIMTECIEESASGVDITGLNYMTVRHEMEHEIHPNRVIIGAETYPADIANLWGIVNRNPHVIGDFTWTGYDYIGEAGCGIFYYDGSSNFGSHWPDSIAYIGDINIIGYRRPISYLREIVFGLRKDPYIAVERVNRYGMKHSQTPWMLKDNIASWTWHGYEGKPAVVDIYSDAQEVELFLNGKSFGKKAAGEENQFTATFEIIYEPGELTAVSYIDGIETGHFNLVTAEKKVELDIDVDRSVINADGADLSYIMIGLKDEKGTKNLYAKKEITIAVDGVGYLQGFGSANPHTLNSYDNTTWETFDGYVLAAIRAGFEEGEIKVTITADDCETKIVTVKVKK